MMKRIANTVLVLALLWMLLIPGPAALSAARRPESPAPQMRGEPVYLLYDPEAAPHRVVPDQTRHNNIYNATITVHFVPNGEADGAFSTCMTWPPQAQAAFNYAAHLWSTRINSTVPIVIRACWANLGSGNILGYGGAWDYRYDFTGAPLAGTVYPIALANARAGSDLNGGEPDMLTTYNSNFSWYYGIDGNPPAGQMDFVTVVLHEIAHGLGFSGSMEWQSGTGRWGAGTPYPDAYDRFAQDGGGTPLLNYANPSTALGTALTNNNVWFNGAHAKAANGGNRVKLYAPTTWSPGSSYAHLDYNTYAGTVNALMVFAIGSGTAIHDPGPVTMGILRDIGWTIPAMPVIPSVTGITSNSGLNVGNVNVTVSGTDFFDGAQLRLTRSGQADIVATHVNVNTPTALTGRFNLKDAALGTWNVVVINPGDLTGQLNNAFTVKAATDWIYLPLISRQ